MADHPMGSPVNGITGGVIVIGFGWLNADSLAAFASPLGRVTETSSRFRSA